MLSVSSLIISCVLPSYAYHTRLLLIFIFCHDISAVKIKKNPENVKFKVRCSRFLYTLVITDKEKAEKLKQSLPPGNKIASVAHFITVIDFCSWLTLHYSSVKLCTIFCLFLTYKNRDVQCNVEWIVIKQK